MSRTKSMMPYRKEVGYTKSSAVPQTPEGILMLYFSAKLSQKDVVHLKRQDSERLSSKTNQ